MRLYRVAAVSLFASGLLWPLAVVAWNGLTLTGWYEESVGYRYFYNLRQLYEPATYLFLPQGQSTDLIQKIVHLLLIAAGLPVDNVNPRIDYFAYLSIVAFQLANTAAFAWLIVALRDSFAIFLSAFFWLIPSYMLSAGYLLLQPDYPAIELAFAIAAAGFFARIEEPFEWSQRMSIAMGAFLGVAMATKITLALFPAVVIAYASALSRPDTIRPRVALVIATSITAWILIVGSNLLGHVPHIRAYLKELVKFIESRSGSGIGTTGGTQWPAWVFERFLEVGAPTRFIYVAPVFALLGLIGATRKTLTLAGIMLIGAIASSVYLSQRDYDVTLIEACLYLFLLLWVYTSKIWWPAVTKRTSTYNLRATSLAVCAGLFLFLVQSSSGIASLLGRLERNTDHQRQLAAIISSSPGKHLWIVPDNNYRPLSVESSIMKGGSGPSGQWLNPDSALMRRLFPNIVFRFYEQDLSSTNIEEFQHAFFAYIGDIKDTLAILQERHRLRLAGWSCREAVRFEGRSVAICSRSE
jgi:hypothetical protein